VAIGDRLQNAICPDGLAARFLGDEFILVPPLTTTREQASVLAEKAKELLSKPFLVDSTEVMITTSIGTVSFPDDGETVDILLRNVEAAKYEAKRQGRNTVVAYTTAFHQKAQYRLMLENKLRRAMENNEFSLHYQPQICLKKGAVCGVEALLRWNPADMPPVSPFEFIPILEESGLIVPVGAWVLHEACRQAVAWQQAGLPQVRMSVNISAVQFQRGDLDETVRLAINATAIPPSQLCLELTESMLLIDTHQTQEKLLELRDIGINLSLDDFGTGYSSLSYLSRMPVQELKIDQSFVRRLHTTPSDTALVNAIIVMAQTLGLELVAEGVETEEQKDHLAKRGCDIIQGYLFSRPLPADECFRFISRSK
jgi:EAL domain-containing protein (putative c-di-GMP-specific phosphodiesterase class I)